MADREVVVWLVECPPPTTEMIAEEVECPPPTISEEEPEAGWECGTCGADLTGTRRLIVSGLCRRAPTGDEGLREALEGVLDMMGCGGCYCGDCACFDKIEAHVRRALAAHPEGDA